MYVYYTSRYSRSSSITRATGFLIGPYNIIFNKHFGLLDRPGAARRLYSITRVHCPDELHYKIKH